jgi:hypothetical protein
MDENQFKQALETILDDLKTKLENSKGIDVFVKNRAKFEGWLKVEIVNILCNRILDKTDKIIPEKYRIDVVFDDSALELKTVNTNYRGEDIENKNRPITLNVEQLEKDIDKLRKLHKKGIKNKAILFVVFPLPGNKAEKFEAEHLSKLRVEKQDIMYRQFKTINGITNRIYSVIVREQ